MRVRVQESDMMSNVISFPQRVKTAPKAFDAGGAKTLFLHIKNTTLIAHLAAATKPEVAGGRIGKKL